MDEFIRPLALGITIAFLGSAPFGIWWVIITEWDHKHYDRAVAFGVILTVLYLLIFGVLQQGGAYFVQEWVDSRQTGVVGF